MPVQRGHDLFRGLIKLFLRAQAFGLQKGRPDVRGHDDDGVAEINSATPAVGQAPVIHHLQ